MRSAKGLAIFVLCLLIVICLGPVLAISIYAFFPVDTSLTVSTRYIARVGLNTVVLVLGVASLSSVLGVGLAFASFCLPSKLKKYAISLLILPMLIPPYVASFMHIQLWNHATWIRSLWGAIFVLSLSFYPYIFLLSRQGLLSVYRQFIDLGHSLQLSYLTICKRIFFPLLKPWYYSGLLIVIMEVISDFASVYMFNVDTLTTAIYRMWFDYFSIPLACRFALFLIIISILLNQLKDGMSLKSYESNYLWGAKFTKTSYVAVIFVLFVVMFSSILPISYLLYVFFKLEKWPIITLLSSLRQSLFLACLGTFFISLMSGGLFLLWGISRMFFYKYVPIFFMGYALPGTVIALGTYKWLLFVSQSLVGTIFSLIVGYTARFFLLAYYALKQELLRIPNYFSYLKALYKLDHFQGKKLLYKPYFLKGISLGMILIFVEIIKEVPITLILRPFGWRPLSVWIFELSSEGLWDQVAYPALALVLLSSLFFPIIHKALEHD